MAIGLTNQEGSNKYSTKVKRVTETISSLPLSLLRDPITAQRCCSVEITEPKRRMYNIEMSRDGHVIFDMSHYRRSYSLDPFA